MAQVTRRIPRGLPGGLSPVISPVFWGEPKGAPSPSWSPSTGSKYHLLSCLPGAGSSVFTHEQAQGGEVTGPRWSWDLHPLL